MTKSLIISRYNEDISWLEEFVDFKIIIYNKGEKLSNNNFSNIFEIPNVGRESHTWVYHIIKNYETLDDINIFLQGRIDDLDCMAYKNPNEYIKRINKYGFVASRYGMLGPNHWDWNVGIENNPKYKKAWDKNEISKSKIGFKAFSKKLFPSIPILVSTSYGGCFAVKKESIKKYDLKFYKKLLESFNKSKNPIEGHYMERLWCYMFTKNEPIFDSIFDVIYTKVERSRFKYIYKLMKTFKK
tara:strand:+ start:384 stop:1109 length:726 start_codon:yes stop_codon:yes gene_type:complete